MNIILRKLWYRIRPVPKRRTLKSNIFKKLVIYILLIIMMFGSVFGLIKIEKRLGPLAQEAAVSALNREITRETHIIVRKILEKEKIDTKSLLSIAKSDNGEIVSMTPDYNTINKIISLIAVDLPDKLAVLDVIKTKLPLGILFSDTAFTGMGFSIPIRVFASSTIDVQLVDEFVDVGINQTRYHLLLDIKIPAKISGILTSKSTEVAIQIPLAETVIMGDVPQAYIVSNTR